MATIVSVTRGHAATQARAQGLAYSVSGGFDTSPVDHPGLFVAGGETAAPAEFLALLHASLQARAAVCQPLSAALHACGLYTHSARPSVLPAGSAA